jgi:pimeloyl-ACP methyl ester carboxylesterase
MNRGSEVQLDTRQGRLGGLAWHCEGAPRVLALHGWLDNAASFAPLAPLLQGLDLVALDLPGHGHSEHRHATTRYHFIDYPFNIDAALDALAWQDCHLLGHSLGASIAAVYAAAAPERVRSLTLLDGLGPIAADADRTAERLRRSLAKYRQGTGARRHFDSLGEMVAARCRVSDLTEAAARLICERSACQVGERLTWRSDPALNWVSALVMTEDQVLDLLRHVESHTLVVQATTESGWFTQQQLEARMRALQDARHLSVEGHHHFHMDEPGAIAEPIRAFILENDQPAKETQTHE